VNCFMENQTISVMFMMHVGGVEMPPIVGCVLAPFALSDNCVHIQEVIWCFCE